MTLEVAPASTQSDGKWRIWYVPTGSNAKSVAILNGATAKGLTYGLTGDGYKNDKTQVTVPDKRLTMIQDLARPGRVTETLELICVASTVADTPDAILSALAISGAQAQIVVRPGVDNAAIATVGQTGRLHTVVVGVRRPLAPVENDVDKVAYTLYPVLPTEDPITFVA